MNKSILIVDTPSSCFDCPLFREGIVDTCFPLDRDIHDEEGGFDEDGDRPSWCPLRPLPQKKVPYFDPNANTYDEEKERSIMNEIDGYNRCIDEIMGEIEG